MTRRQNRAFAAMPLPTRVPDLIAAARAILAAATDNPLLPDPQPPLATIAAAITALDQAETDRLTHTVGTTPVRNTAESALRATLRAYKAYVQQQADANPEQAAALIPTAGLSVRKPSTRAKAFFTAKPGRISGSVGLEVKAAAKRAVYEWEWSADGGETWTAAARTLQAKATITGLPIGQYVQFRFRVTTKTGQSDYSRPLSVLVK
jgi:hypothetical protein